MPSVTKLTIPHATPGINGAFVGIDTALRKNAVSVIHPDKVDLFLVDAKKLNGAPRLSFILSSLCTIVSEAGNVTLGAIEDGAYQGVGRLYQLGQAQGIGQVALITNKVPLVNVAPTSLKKFFTGDGKAGKSKMMTTASVLLGVDITDDNLADSYALARLAMLHHTKKVTTRSQAEVIVSLTVEML